MGSIARSGTWDEASSPAATRLARRFEDAWRDPRRKRKPDPVDFLPEGVEGTASPAAWLVLLRADLNLRWDDGENVRVETYRERFPKLDAETLVALCYEEFCRREEDGLTPFPAEYDERFPDLAERLRRVFDIHEIIGNAGSTSLHVPGPEPIPFPETGQTIAGFHLVEELGRGSFARVFLAQERQLADRPVALKVARTGSREPQTLARLQHTHIVPVHSYRTDPATGLHLLCMPYFGRITLGRLLAEPGARVAPSGAELLAVLDRLDPSESPTINSSARSALSSLSFARAIAWWGARLAEALNHAHDRGVLHRDIKPSNVLLTDDGLPMLLDFNLAGAPWAERKEFEPDHLGGTLAYMAPEHLEAVALGEDNQLDARADLFSLGVLLFEALTGSRPFPSPSGSSVPEALQRAVEDRRREPPRICVDHPEIPVALERVIRRCLAPEPTSRYANAGELAADLQAVAEDEPLRWTREPLIVRVIRKARRSWRKAVLVSVVTGSVVALIMSTFREGEEQRRLTTRAKQLLEEGRGSLRADNFVTASAQFQEVKRLATNRPELDNLSKQAIQYLALARFTGEVRDSADALFEELRILRDRMTDGESIDRDLAIMVAPFRILDDIHWNQQPRLTSLDASRRSRLIREVEEILFQFVVRIDPDDRESSRRGIEICDRAIAFTDDKKPWISLRSWLDDSPLPGPTQDPATESSALSCFEWGLLDDRLGRTRSATQWLLRATDLDPKNVFYEYQLAKVVARQDATESLVHYRKLIGLEPDNPRFWRERARTFQSIGEWEKASSDEKKAASLASKLSSASPHSLR